MKSRNQTIGLAYIATGGAKIVGALVQLAVLPIAAKALGPENFGLLFAVAAMASFPLIAMAGFSPAASVLMSKAKAESEGKRVGAYFWSLSFGSLALGALLTVLVSILLCLFEIPGGTAAYLPLTLLIFILLNFAAASVEGSRAAFGEAHYNNGFAVSGSAITLVAVLFAPDGASTAYYFCAIYMAPVIGQICNLAAFIAQHRHGIGKPRIDPSLRREIGQILSANIQAQGGMVLYLHGSILAITSIFGATAAALVGAFVRIATLFHSMLIALSAPVLPTLTDASVRGDRRWQLRGVGGLLGIAGAVLAGLVVLIAAFGHWIAVKFFGIRSPEDSGFFAVLAIFILCYSITHLLFLVRQSLLSHEQRGIKILIAALIGLVLATLFSSGNVAIFLFIQASSMAALATVVYGRDIFRVVTAAHSGTGV